MLNPLRILRSSSRITLVIAVSAPVNFALNLFVARAVAPDLLGQINFVTLWLAYANLITPGIFSGGQREMIHCLGQKEDRLAWQAQNVGVTGEMLWSLLPASIFLLAPLFFPEPLKRWGFVIASLIYLLATLNKLLANLHLAHQRFDLYARLNLVRVLIPPALIVLFVYRFGPLTVLLATAVTEGVLLILYLTVAPHLALQPDLNWPRMLDFTRIGFPIALGGFVYWAYRLTGQTSVAFWFPAQALAFYTFSANIVTLITRAFGDFSGVLMPVLWRELGQSDSPQRLHRETARISIFVMAAACATANLAQVGFAPLVHLIVPKYVDSIPIFEVLAFNIVVLTMTFVPSLVLDSAVVNKQWPHLSVWAVGLGVNLVANYLAVRLGRGLLAIAWNDIWIQLLVVIALYALAQRHLYPTPRMALRVYLTLGLLGGAAALVFLSLRLSFFAIDIPATFASALTALGRRLVFMLLVWGILGALIARSVFARPANRPVELDSAQP